MQKRIFGLILVCVGAWLFVHGWERKESPFGSMSETGSRIANHFDGGTRTPKHTIYLVGGGLLIACGAFMIFSGSRKG